MFHRKTNYELSNYTPLREISESTRNFFSDPLGFFNSRGLTAFRTDIKDKGDTYLLEADLPGFAKEDIDLVVNNDVLSINAVRHSEHEEKDSQGKYVFRERSYGSYRRQFDISDVKTGEIQAKYDNGVLTLRMPKKEGDWSGKRLDIE